MTLLFLDIETVPHNDDVSEEDIVASMPGSIKLEKTKQKWISENKDSAKQAVIKKRSLNHYECSIICISYSIGGDIVKSLVGTEQKILLEFQNDIKEYLDEYADGSGLTLVGHNIKKFDAPIIFLRAAKYGLTQLFDLFYFGRKEMIDTMYVGTYFDYKGFVSLDTLCTYFGIPTPKKEMDGSKVYPAYKEGRLSDIAKYCEEDVHALINVYNKLSI